MLLNIILSLLPVIIFKEFLMNREFKKDNFLTNINPF